MAPHSSTLAWAIPWAEEPGRLQSMGSQRVGHDWATSPSLFPFMHRRRKWQSTPVFLPGESQGWGAWWASVYGVTQSRTRLKRLSSSSSMQLCISLVHAYMLQVYAWWGRGCLQKRSSVNLTPSPLAPYSATAWFHHCITWRYSVLNLYL